MNDPFIKHKEFGLSYDDYIGIFNKLVRPKTATHCFDILPKIFNNHYMFKKGWILSTLDILKHKHADKLSRSVLVDFNSKDLRSNLFKWGGGV